MMKKPTDGNDLVAAIKEFETALPDWWWSIGYCGISRDATCWPSRASGGPDYSTTDNELELRIFDNGFQYDDVAPDSTVANSLRNVLRQALEARAELRDNPEAARQRYIATMMKQRGLSLEKAAARAAELFG